MDSPVLQGMEAGSGTSLLPEFAWLFLPGSGSIFSAFDPETLEGPWLPSLESLGLVMDEAREDCWESSQKRVECAYASPAVRDLYRRYLELGLVCFSAERLEYAEAEEAARLRQGILSALLYEGLETLDPESEGFEDAVREKQGKIQEALVAEIERVCP